MPLLQVLIVLILSAMAVGLIESMVPMEPSIVIANRVLIGLAVVLYLLQWLGIFGSTVVLFWGPALRVC